MKHKSKSSGNHTKNKSIILSTKIRINSSNYHIDKKTKETKNKNHKNNHPVVGHSMVSKKKGSLIEHFKKQLSGGRFRMLNEQLYTISGEEALKMFQEDPSLFEVVYSNYLNKFISITMVSENKHNLGLLIQLMCL